MLKEKVSIKIPAGIQSGTILRLRGRGMYNQKGDRGDGFVRIYVDTPKKLSRKAKKLFSELREEGL